MLYRQPRRTSLFAACLAAIGTVLNNITKNRAAGISPLGGHPDLLALMALASIGVMATTQLLWLVFEKGWDADRPLPLGIVTHLAVHGVIVFIAALSFFAWSGWKARSERVARPTLQLEP